MRKRTLTRRDFLRLSTLTTAGAVAAACAAPTPVVVEKEKVVTQVVEKEVPVEKVVKETKIVEKVVEKPVEKVVEKEKIVERIMTPTPSPLNEAPELHGLVAAGELPPLEERLPVEPMVIEPVEEIGQYGGTWHRVAIGPGDVGIFEYRLWYGNLIRWNIMGTDFVPNVAKSWEVSPDGKTFTFYLREGMKWSDGEPYTADDLMFWYEDVLLNEELTPVFPSWLKAAGKQGKLEKVDDYTVRFVFPEPHGLFLTFLASAYGVDMTGYPKHYLKQFHPNYVEKAELDKKVKDAGFEFWYELFGDRRNEIANLDLPVIAAWRFTQLSPAVPVILERNPYYWKVDSAGNQLPYLDKIEVDVVEDIEMLNMKVVAGEVDMQMRHVLLENYPLFKENAEKGDYRIIRWTYGNISDTVIAINLCNKDPVLREIVNDKRFRYALSYAINREEVIESVYLGQAEPGQISPLPTSPFYLEEQAKNALEYDVDKANALLDEMGLKWDAKHEYRLRPDGKTLSLVYEYAPVFGAWKDIGELLVGYWKDIGVKLSVKEEARPLFYERKAALEHDIGVWTGASEFNPLIDPRWFIPFSVESVHAICYAQWWNSGGKEGEEPTGDLRKVLELYDQIKATVDMDKQIELFHEILRLNKENLWTIGIAVLLPKIVIVKNYFRNVPEKAVATWHLLTPGATMPEQYFIKR